MSSNLRHSCNNFFFLSSIKQFISLTNSVPPFFFGYYFSLFTTVFRNSLFCSVVFKYNNLSTPFFIIFFTLFEAFLVHFFSFLQQL